MTPPAIWEALWKYRFERGLGMQTVEPAPSAQVSAIQVASEHRVTVLAPVNVKSAGDAGQDQEFVDLSTQKDTLFSVSSGEPLRMTLKTPDNTEITPENYNLPPVTPIYSVAYEEKFIFQSNTPEEPGTVDQPRLRFVLAATHPDWAAVDVSLDGTLLFEDLSLVSSTPVDYMPINPGEHTLSIVPSGGGTPVVHTFTAEAQKYYSILASGNGTTPDLTTLTDDHTSPSAQGKALLRFVHSAPYPNPVDVFIGGTQVLNDAAYGSQSEPFEFPAGEALVEIKDAASGDDGDAHSLYDLGNQRQHPR